MRPWVIVAGGPSVTLRQIRSIGMARSKDCCRVIAINDAMYLCWFADIGFATDASWWRLHHGVPGFRGVKFCVDAVGYPDITVLDRERNEVGQPILDGFDPRPGMIRTGHNSGYGAVHIAANLGAKQIILVGYDFSDDGARDHWFGRHDADMDKHSDTAAWRRLFRGLTDELRGRGIAVLNASLKSTIDWLPRYDVSALEDEIGEGAVAAG